VSINYDAETGGPVTVNITGNTATQGADKTVDALGGNQVQLQSPGGELGKPSPEALDAPAASAMTPAEIENRALRKRVADLEAGTAP